MDQHDDGLDIPAFLRRQKGWKPEPGSKPAKRVRAKPVKKWPFHIPRSIEPAGWEILKQQEREKQEKKKARLAMLRELGKAKRSRKR